MTIRWQSTQVGRRSMRTHLGTPDRAGTHPGLGVAHHVFGIDASTQDAVHRCPLLAVGPMSAIDPKRTFTVMLVTPNMPSYL